ncbi:hypothetical protein DPMN_142876 [Dreissena polymorpha]|uniref:Uncharacterized protein n=1 Tax=Dreissena polymorpha TaxID=45954 RepID=A0A9D4GG54_DREPO|nr:hypothetical protein DPMN_142876 [Dreissena polymorpha]
MVSVHELSDVEGCDLTAKHRRQTRRYNRRDKERTFTQSGNEETLSPETSTSRWDISSRENEAANLSSS